MRWKHETLTEAHARHQREFEKWNVEREAKIQAQKEWHKVFAWRPRYTQDRGVKMWLEYVLRRRTGTKEKAFHRTGPLWEYRPITILEKDLGTTGD